MTKWQVAGSLVLAWALGWGITFLTGYGITLLFPKVRECFL